MCSGWRSAVDGSRSTVNGLVSRDDHALRRRRGLDEAKRCGCTTIGEEPSPGAEHQWIDGENELIDETTLQQRLHEHAAAEDDDVLSWRLAQLRDFVSCIPAEQLRVHPWQRLFERA